MIIHGVYIGLSDNLGFPPLEDKGGEIIDRDQSILYIPITTSKGFR